MGVRDRIVELVRVKAGDLIANEQNWRKHPPAQAKAMRGILEDVGYAAALIARKTDKGLELIDGHLRADLDAEQEVPVLVVDLDDDEADLVLATLDPIGAMARTDREVFRKLLADIEAESDGVKDLLEAVGKVSLPGESRKADLDDVAERVREGELYQIGKHRLICGDSTDSAVVSRLFEDDEAAAIITDPPYQVGYGKGRTSITRFISTDWSELYVESDPTSGLLSAFLSVGLAKSAKDARLFVWMASTRMCALRSAFEANNCVPHQQIIWRKSQHASTRQFYGVSRYEPALLGWRKGHDPRNAQVRSAPGLRDDLWELPSEPRRDRKHPTTKPLECFARPIRDLTEHGDIVYEPFAGSGTAIVAAEQTGRRCYGVELSPRFCDVALARIEEETGQTAELIK